MIRFARILQVLTALGLGACGMSVDQVEDVEDLRILAVRADPPEVLISAAALDFANLDLAELEFDVQFSALVVDPRGGRVDLEWQFCPIESFDACADFEQVRDESPTYASELDTMRAIQFAETGVLPRDEALSLTDEESAARAVWPFATSPFIVSAPASLTAYHAETNFFGLGSGAWPSAQVRIAGNEDTLFANKRFVLGLEDYGAFSDILRDQFDFDVCPTGVTPSEQPGCIELRPRDANTNPVFDRLEIAFGDQADAPFTTISRRVDGTFEPPVLSPGEMVRIKPVFTAESFESYQELQTNVDTQRIQAVDITEEISVAWYISAGEIQDTLTWPLFTRTLDTVYTAPSLADLDNSDRVSMWLVAQDQRGGSSWAQLELVVE